MICNDDDESVDDNFGCEFGQVGELAIRVGDGRGRQFASGKNNKRTMKGSWSDLTAIAC